MSVVFSLGALVAFILVYATHVALSANDSKRRSDAYRVLRVLCWTVGVTCVSVVARLHVAGML
ncbi:hypothetical protein EV186_1011823 [Labedaea rhizosphaerae]|uniref:Uncharacterized protein n=1 Tax=Labedaea rhizosphaerae TaxID=598644 RepID=A0A4V3D0I3_LABRH|nr:hypothetical protein EV186_1011823 [Labedaea rhizosphaerae]